MGRVKPMERMAIIESPIGNDEEGGQNDAARVEEDHHLEGVHGVAGEEGHHSEQISVICIRFSASFCPFQSIIFIVLPTTLEEEIKQRKGFEKFQLETDRV